jgi:nucleotide-binding universal stress UspA family protein
VRKTFEGFCETNAVPMTDKVVLDQVSASWHEEFGRVSEVLIQRGRLADAVAIARPGVKKSTIRRSPAGENLQAVMLFTGRPVLIVPPEWKPRRVQHAAIGWNESLEASRALALAMPWLPQMSSVHVVVSAKREPRVKELLHYLAWHNVKADVQLLDGRGETVGEAMLNICSDIGADFLVVGGFSHARARELLIGGVTRHLLAHSSIITVMVH